MGTDENHSSDKGILRALKNEKKRLHSRIARPEAKEITYKNRISALEEEIKSGNSRKLKRIIDEISNAGSTPPVREQGLPAHNLNRCRFAARLNSSVMAYRKAYG